MAKKVGLFPSLPSLWPTSNTMPRLINPVNWELDQDEREGPLVTLKNNNGHKLHIHPISSTLVRVLHTLPQDGRSGVKLRNHRDLPKAGRDGIVWEKPRQVWETKVSVVLRTETKASLRLTHSLLCFQLNSPSKSLEIWSTNSELRIQVDYSHAITLSWYHSNQEVAFLRDFKHAYTFDAVSRKVYHLVSRSELKDERRGAPRPREFEVSSLSLHLSFVLSLSRLCPSLVDHIFSPCLSPESGRSGAVHASVRTCTFSKSESSRPSSAK